MGPGPCGLGHHASFPPPQQRDLLCLPNHTESFPGWGHPCSSRPSGSQLGMTLPLLRHLVKSRNIFACHSCVCSGVLPASGT